MKILVINIALRPPPARKFLPIGLGYIVSAMKRAGFEFDLMDLDAHPRSKDETEAFLNQNQYDIVAMGCIVTGYKYVKWLTNTIKSAFPATRIIVGNSVASSIPDILLTKTGADIAVLGEADHTIVELLSLFEEHGLSADLKAVKGISYKQGDSIRKTPPRPPVKDINEIPTPDWDLFDIELFIKNLSESLNEPLPPIPREDIRPFPINTARGCPYKCTFCYQVFRDIPYRPRSPESIVREMAFLNEKYGINHFCFNDDLTFFSIPQINAFIDAMLSSGLEVYFESNCRSGLFHKDEHVQVARRLKQAGGTSLGFSLESANPQILQLMDKKTSVTAFSRQVDILQKAGMPIRTSIVIGYPNETPETIKETMDCCIQNGLYPSAGYLLPQPGTGMYAYALENGFIREEEEYLLMMGDRQDLRLNMTCMTDEELENTVKNELDRCSRALGLNIENGETLLKTGFYRQKKTPQPDA